MDSVTKDAPAARRMAAAALATALLVLAGCATPPENDPAAMEAYKRANDPIEPFNRHMLEVNLVLDNAVLKPVAYIYKETLPEFAQDSVDSFLHNLRSPVILANDLMQGDGDRAWNTIIRFAANSTFGLGGLIDVAADMGYPSHDEDFGQTLAVWGVGDGPYLMLPLFGPSNPRDAVGRIVDTLIDPLTWFAPTEVQYAQFATEAVNERAKNYDAIEDLKKTSLDFYAAVRSLYRQRRTDEINNGAATANPSGSPSPMSGEPDSPAIEQKASEPAPNTSMRDPEPAMPETKPAPAEPKVAVEPVPMPPRDMELSPTAMPEKGVALEPVPMPEKAATPMHEAEAQPAPESEAKPMPEAKAESMSAPEAQAAQDAVPAEDGARAASEAAVKATAAPDSEPTQVPPTVPIQAAKAAPTQAALAQATPPAPTKPAEDFYAATRELAAGATTR